MDNIHFEAMLKSALIDDLLDNYFDVILNAGKQNIPFSRKYLKRRERIVHKAVRIKNDAYMPKRLGSSPWK